MTPGTPAPAIPAPPSRLLDRKPARGARSAAGFSPTARFRGRGFTLIEMLIVIAILLLLLGIGMALTTVLGTGERGLTQSILSQLEAINTEHKALTGSYVGDSDDASTPNDVRVVNITRFMEKIKTSENFEPFIGKIPTENLVRFDDPSPPPGLPDNYLLRVNDAWDKPIAYVHPTYWQQSALSNTVHDVNGDEDQNDTNTPAIDIRYDRLPKRPLAYFASAGPDGEWGDAALLARRQSGATLSTSGSPPTETDRADQASDNLYSFDLEQ